MQLDYSMLEYSTSKIDEKVMSHSVYSYAILAIHFKDVDWVEKTKSKVWFQPECEEALKMALNRAKEIIELS